MTVAKPRPEVPDDSRIERRIIEMEARSLEAKRVEPLIVIECRLPVDESDRRCQVGEPGRQQAGQDAAGDVPRIASRDERDQAGPVPWLEFVRDVDTERERLWSQEHAPLGHE